MRNLKLHLAYDGTNYHGWQVQPNDRSVQETVQGAVYGVTGEHVKVTGCSRTDAGVHARHYVCNFHTETKIPCERMPYAMNANLPDDIAVTLCEEAEEGFNARYDAKSKIYVYRIHNSNVRDPFEKERAWQYPIPLDLDKMQRAAQYMVGTHDFTAFMAAGGQQKQMEKEMYEVSVSQQGKLFEIKVHANSYLYNMVRIITGTLVYVGNGKLQPDDVKEILRSKDRKRAGMTAPPQGLYLHKVFYE